MILTTDDGGETWSRIAAEGMPEALPGEGAFAASGTCLVVQGEPPRLVRHGRRAGLPQHRPGPDLDGPRDADPGGSRLLGRLLAGVPGCGARGGRRRRLQGAGAGGSGRRRHLGRRPDLEAAAGLGTRRLPLRRRLPAGSAGPTLVAVGPTGADRSQDGGETWTSSATRGSMPSARRGGAGWAVGEDGRIARFDPERQASGRSRSPPPGRSS